MTGSNDWAGIVADIERTATRRGRRRAGCGWLEGTRLHERALRAGRSVRAAVTTASYAESGDSRALALLEGLSASGCRLVVAPDAVVDRLTEGRGGGIVGLVELPPPLAAVDLASLDGTLLVAWNVEDPGNVGALARTAHASSAVGLVTTGAGDPFHPRAIRTSRGSVFKIPCIHLADGEALDALQTRETVGAVTGGGESPDDVVVTGGAPAIVVGSEAFGLPAEIAAALDRRVTIPMSREADSFSVNAAAAILLWVFRSSRDAGR